LDVGGWLGVHRTILLLKGKFHTLWDEPPVNFLFFLDNGLASPHGQAAGWRPLVQCNRTGGAPGPLSTNGIKTILLYNFESYTGANVDAGQPCASVHC
jgi:hypothetical protein